VPCTCDAVSPVTAGVGELPTSPVILVPADALVMPEPASNPKLVADPRSIVVPLDFATALDATSRIKIKLVREFIFSLFTLAGEYLFVAAANPSK
jgi:hypothetical protein